MVVVKRVSLLLCVCAMSFHLGMQAGWLSWVWECVVSHSVLCPVVCWDRCIIWTRVCHNIKTILTVNTNLGLGLGLVLYIIAWSGQCI